MHTQMDLDKDYQPDYAAHQVGLFVVDFIKRYGAEKQVNPDKPTEPWKYDASRLIEALDMMNAQAKNAHVTLVVDKSKELLTKIEKALQAPNSTDLAELLRTTDSPGKS